MMKNKTRQRLERKGWRVGDASQFLELSEEEVAYIELKLALSDALRARRREQGLTQVELAKRLGSSQSRVAKMEAGDPTVSIDLLIRSLLALGSSKKALARAFL